MPVSLHTVISQIHGVSGPAVVRAILQGERDPAKRADLCAGRILKKKRAAVERSLHGWWQDEHRVAHRPALAGGEFCAAQVQECDAASATPPAVRTRDLQLPEVQGPPPQSGRHHVLAGPQLHEHLLAWSHGQDAAALPGFTDTSWLKLLSEMGTDLARWPNEKAFCSWLGLAPGKDQSGKKAGGRGTGRRRRRGRFSGWPRRAWAAAATWRWADFTAG